MLAPHVGLQITLISLTAQLYCQPILYWGLSVGLTSTNYTPLKPPVTKPPAPLTVPPKPVSILKEMN